MTAATLPELPPALEQAGCRLIVVKRQIAVLDRDGVELERAPRKQADWLWSASSYALIERWAAQLGLCHALHLHELRVRLWWPGADPEAAAWLEFDQALANLAAIAAGELVEQVAAQIQAARPQAGEEAEAILPATFVIQARTSRARGVWRPRRRQRPALAPARRWPAVWQWLTAEARRVLGSRRWPGSEGEARGPPGQSGAACYPPA